MARGSSAQNISPRKNIRNSRMLTLTSCENIPNAVVPFTARRSRNQECVRPANISGARSKENSVLFAPSLPVLRVKFRKAQHRGHKESQRTTEKSASLFAACTHLFYSMGPSVPSAAFLGVLSVKFRNAQRKFARPANSSTPSSTERRETPEII